MAETTVTATNPTDANPSSEASTATATTVTEAAGTEQQHGTTSETLLGGSKPEEGKTEEKKPEGAPESYDFKAPEGKEYDTSLIGSFSEAAKEANLTQDAAQKLLDKVAPALASRQAEQIEAVRNGWIEATKADKEIGGDKLPENLAFAKKAIDTFGSPELRTLLETTGLGNNLEVIRAFVKAGKAISEDTFVSGSPNGKTSVNAADVLYPTMKKE